MEKHIFTKNLFGIEQRKNQLLTPKGGDSVFSLFLSVDIPPEYFKKIYLLKHFRNIHSCLKKMLRLRLKAEPASLSAACLIILSLKRCMIRDGMKNLSVLFLIHN